MPVLVVNNLSEDTFLIIWNITESVDEMNQLLNARLSDWNAPASHRENRHWLASRLAILHHFRNEEIDLMKDEFNKPHLKVDEQDVFVSITHSFDRAAVLVSMSHPVALDMERIDPRVERVMHKFCNAPELEMVHASTNKTEALSVIWSAKETLYKWYGKKELDFRLHLYVNPFVITNNNFLLEASINKDHYVINKKIAVGIKDGYVLTVIP